MNINLPKFTVLLALATVAFVQAAAQAQVVRVAQESAPGADDFDSHILGYIEAFTTPLTTSQYYAFDGDSYSNPNASTILTLNKSHLFIVAASEGLSLFIVHDSGSTNGGGSADMQFDLIDDSASILAKDAPHDSYSETGTLFTSGHDWSSPFTDGLAIGALDGDFTMFARFTAATTGLDGWRALSEDGSIIPLTLAVDRRVRLDRVPEPSALLLLVISCTVLLRLRHIRHSK